MKQKELLRYPFKLKFRTEPNSIELILFCNGEPYPNFYEFFDYFCVFCKKFGSVRSNRIDQLSIIQYLHHQNASFSAHLKFGSIEPNRTFYKKKKKKKSKIRVRFAVTNSYLIRFGSIRFDKRLTFDSFTVALSFQFDSEFIIIMHAWELCMGKITNPIAYF